MSAVVKLKAAPQGLPVIEVKPGRLAVMCDEAVAAVASTLRVYDKGSVLVALNPSTGSCAALTSATMLVELARSARWVRKVKDQEDGWKLVPDDPPRAVAAAVVDMGSWEQIPRLRAVVDHEMWCSPGRAHTGGYDNETGIYSTARASASPARKDATREEADEALCTLQDAIKTFPWAARHDEAAALASMLAALARPILEIAPMVLITAPTPGSGKGLLGQAIARFAQAEVCAGATLSSDDEEVRKDLFARLLAGHGVIFFDEIAAGTGAAIDSPALRTLATSQVFSSRILGSNKTAEVGTCAVVVVTANNATPSADSARRMLEIRLDARCETPAARRFSGPTSAEIISGKREEMIRAAMTIQAAYIHAGMPGIHDLPPVSNYNHWNLWARGPIAWLMGVDPAQRLVDAQRVDSTAGEVGDALAAIYRRMVGARWKANELLQHQDTTSALRDALGLPPTREPGTRQIGRWLLGARDRIAGGLVLREASRSAGSITWRIEKA